MNDAISHFSTELLDAGITTRRRALLVLLYHRALTAPSPASWARLYRTLFSALHLLAQETPAPTWRSHAAVEALLRVVEDDLGSLLFGTEALIRLRASLARFAPARPRSAFAWNLAS